MAEDRKLMTRFLAARRKYFHRGGLYDGVSIGKQAKEIFCKKGFSDEIYIEILYTDSPYGPDIGGGLVPFFGTGRRDGV